MSSYLNYTDPSGNEVEVLESLKGWIIDPDTQAQKTIENYENQRLSLEDAIESGLLNNRAGQIFLDYGDVIMGPPVTLPSSLVGIREAIKGNSDSKEMQRTATAGFYAGFVGQGIEYTQIISKADYQLSLLIVTQKGLNAAANPLTYVEYFRNFSPQEKLEAAKRTAKGAWNGEYDSALGRKTGAAILDYLLVAIGGALMKGESAACEVAESGCASEVYYRTMSQADYDYLRMTGELPATNETFISPTYSFSSDYDGITVEFELRKGTTNSLLDIGVGNNADQAIRDYGVLPQVSKGWTENNAFFKGEGTQTNIGLGKGKALEIFNSNIINFKRTGGK